MKIHTSGCVISSRGECDVIDVTDSVEQTVGESNVSEGQVHVFVQGSTAAITTIEHEPGVVKDLKEAFERWAPKKHAYHHEDAWHDGNGHAHVRASMIGQSACFPVVDGKMVRGTWQQVVLVDFDNKPRQRNLVVQVMGR
ncbi:MAG TPA: secondary thiamine-phosphate synthase enzyme YjbQ [Elusimicrobiota bacterium]|nr:secondary thiamine-phosphate synthase enzyme YjbQ [Elusimicrobiota bacterium]